MIGRTISHYQIIEKLGEGGMGVVYVAEDTHLARRVAIKFLSSLDRPYRARFLREARAVSKLTHPNVATVFDYGETAEGQPYIVMELVKGQTLQELMASSSLSIDQSIQIVASIAEALGEAHLLGIVHRDVKPSNVVLTDRGQIKVLDFGLAKLLDEEVASPEESDNYLSLLATRTQSNVIVGTPLYLSPEQATGKHVDGRSDLFALGALLYEALAGQSAFSGSSTIEIGAQIIHVSPQPPSRINPAVPHELDHVTMKALEKDVKKRYQSAAEMLEDLRRVEALITNGHGPAWFAKTTSPSRAVRQSALTTLAETIRRPRLSLATFAIAILAVGFLVWAVVHWWKPSPYKPKAVALDWYNKGTDALRNGAYLQASKALQQAVNADPNFALAHARLAESWSELDYADRAKDEMLRVTALVPDRSQLPRLDALYLEAINATVARDFPSAAKSYGDIASVTPNEARAYVDLGRALEKNEQTDKAIENYVKATSLDSQYATAYLRAGVGYSRKGDIASASSVLDKAETLFTALQNVEGVAEVFRQRGILFRGAGRFDEAKAQFEKAFETARATGNDSQEISTLLELSFLSYTRGLTSEAQSYASQAVEFARKNQLENLATGSLIELGNAYRAKGDYDNAEKYYKEALEFARSNRGRRREAAALVNLGGLYIQQLRTDEGLALVQQAFTFYRQGNYRRETSVCLTEIGRANRRKGDYQAALEAFNQNLTLAQQTGEEPQIAFTEADIGSVFTEQQHYPEALTQYDRSYAISKSLNNRISIAYSQHNRANVLWRLGRTAEARDALSEAFQIANQPDSTYNALLPDIRLSYAQIDLAERKFGEAINEAEAAIKLAGNQYQTVLIEAKSTLGLAKALSGGGRAGLALCAEAMKTASAAGDAALYSRTQLAQAECALAIGDNELALKLATEVQRRFADGGQLESEWRAWLIAAQANDRAGNSDAGKESLAKAKEVLDQLEQKWGAETFRQYRSRPDIQFYHQQLG